MNRLTAFLGSSIGAKFGMALTGVLLSLFVVGHLAGNLLVFRGRDAMNDYAAGLQGLGPILWVVRLGLLAVFVAHVGLGIRLKRGNVAARPDRYAHERTVRASWASRNMLLTGILVASFAAMHLAHFTLGVLEPRKYAMTFEGRHDVYGMVVAGFHNDLFVALYSVSMVLLGLHLSHGLHSLFQTIGWRHPVYAPLIDRGGRAVAWLLAVGYMTIPISIRIGLVGAGTVG